MPLLLPSPRAGLRDDFLLFIFLLVGDTYLSAEFQSAAAAVAWCSILVSNEHSTQNRASRFGNIPYDTREEQLVHICEEVGRVVNFRLVLDRETGKPKGYGFCEFRDEETALSALRNLQGYEVNGRQLRVDFAENEKGGIGERNQDQTGVGILRERAGQLPLGQSVAVAAACIMAGALGGDQQQVQRLSFKLLSLLKWSNDALTNNLAGMSKHQLYEVMVQMKMLIQQNQQQARQVLIANPQLTKALFQAQIILGMVHPPQMSQVHPTMKVSQPQQQQGPTSNSPTILMQQPPLLPQPRPVAAHSSVVPGQPQQTTQLQQFSLQPMPAQQQLLAQPPFQVSCKSTDQGFISCQPEAIGTGRVMPAGPGMGPGVTSQTGRGPSMTQSGQQMVGMVAGLPMNQAPPSSAGSVGGMPGGSMHCMGPMVMLAGGHAMGGVNQGVPMVIRAPLHPGIGALDSNSRPTYGAPSPGVAMDGGLTAGSGMKPQGYGQAAHPVPGELEQQKALLQQVLSLTPEQINSLPPDQRQQVLQLQQALRT
ncbi:unnamed protein product [Sphagnum jensenii]